MFLLRQLPERQLRGVVEDCQTEPVETATGVNQIFELQESHTGLRHLDSRLVVWADHIRQENPTRQLDLLARLDNLLRQLRSTLLTKGASDSTLHL